MLRGIVNVMFVMRWENDNGFGVGTFSSTFAVDSDAPDTPSLQTAVSLALVDWVPPILVPISTSAWLWYVHYRPRTPDFPYEGIDELGVLTGGTAGVSPWYESLMVKKFTGDPPRYRKGRAYLPFLGGVYAGQTFCDPDDTVLSAAATRFAELATHGGTTLTPVVHKASTDEWEPVVQAKMSQFRAFQRRRNVGKRYYEFP